MRMQRRIAKNRIAQSPITLRLAMVLVIAMLLFFSTFKIIGWIFRLSDTSLQSFNTLTRELKKAGPVLNSVPLRMDEKTAIVFFNEGPVTVKYVLNEKQDTQNPTPDPHAGLLTSIDYTFVRPAQCTGASCVCLCRSVKQEVANMHCLKSVCDNTLKNQFTGDCDEGFACEDGVVFSRSVFMGEPAPRAAYFKLENNRIAVYAANPT